MANSKLNPLFDTAMAALVAALAIFAAAPAVRGSRAQSATEGCLSNLRQIGIAMRMYEDDYNACLVPYAISATAGGQRFTYLVAPYLKDSRAFACPSDLLDRAKSGLPPYPTTYGINWYISRETGAQGGTPPRPRGFVKDPARTICLTDTAVILDSTKGLPAEQWQEDAKRAVTADIYYFYLPQDPLTGAPLASGWTVPNFSGTIVRPFPRHAGRANVCFYDGHAGSVPASQYDPNATKWNTPGCLWDNPIP